MQDQLKQLFGDRFKQDEPMAKYTNFRIGGPAKYFVEVKTVEELKQVIQLANEYQTRYFVFGGGSNMFVADSGFDGIAIKMAMRGTVIDGNRMKAEAGVLSAGLARATAKAGLAGFTWAISLPGTIGGAVRGNAGCFGGEIKDNLVEAELLRDGEVVTVPVSELQLGYRESALKHSNDILLLATFEFQLGDPEILLAELDTKLASRKASQPLDAGSAGCTFKNYEISSDEDLQRIALKLDLPVEVGAARRIPAGWLIDKAELKGFQIGDAQVSERHGNFIVNKGHATADQVNQVISVIKTRLRDQYGIQLTEEVQYID